MSLGNNSSAIGLHKTITDSIQHKELDIKNYCGQGYDDSIKVFSNMGTR